MTSDETLPEILLNTDENISVFKCSKCFAKMDDLKMFKAHMWKSHLSMTEKKCTDLKENDVESKSEPSRNSENEAPRKRRKLEYKVKKERVEDKKVEIKLEKEDEKMEVCEPTEIEKDIKKVKEMPQDDYRLFNFENIDENKILERSLSMFPAKSYDKVAELKRCKVGWAQWRSKGATIMWPCLIEKYAKEANSMKVSFRYYEINNQKGNIFRMPLSKIELFFRSNEHFDIKKASAMLTHFKYDFFLCYTNALKDYEKFLDEQKDALTDTTESQSESACLSTLFKSIDNKSESSKNKYLVNGKMYSLDEIKEIAEKEASDVQKRVNKDREKKSSKLIALLLTTECDEYLESIFSEKIECERHKMYVNGDSTTRRKMKFSSPGPLVEDDQQKLASFINKVTKEKYLNRPENMMSYEYDVLYPEAVIWGLRKLHSLSYGRADLSYRHGFKRTDEERIKQRCHEILNNVEDNSDKNKSLNESEKNESAEFKQYESESSFDKLEDTYLDQEDICMEKEA